jgi:hypothetical protein
VLVPGRAWGDETPWLSATVAALAGPRPSVTVLVEGGDIALADVEASVAAGRRVVVVAGSGRTADALAAAADDGGGDARVRAVVAGGLVETVEPEALADVLRPLLEAS